jgi:hypothetical protein
MLEPVARDSAMVPSFHVRSGADRCALMRLAADSLMTVAAGDFPARDPATARIVFMKVLISQWCHGQSSPYGSPRNQSWAHDESFPKLFRSISRKATPERRPVNYRAVLLPGLYRRAQATDQRRGRPRPQ